MTYSSVGALATVFDAGHSDDPIASYKDIGGRTLRRAMQNGVNLDYRNGSGTWYDALGRPTRIDHKKTGVGTVTGETLAFALNGDVTQQTSLRDVLAEYQYGYDAAGRLTGASPATSRTATRPGIPFSSQWGLDGNGNWNYHNSNLDSQGTQTDNQNFTANEFNAYTQAGGASMTYDPNGNLTHNSQRGQTLRWDAFNRLVNVLDGPTTTAVTFLYDAAGRRVRKSAGPATLGQASTVLHYGFYDHSPLLADDAWVGNESFLAEDFGASQYGGTPFTIPPEATITGVAVTVRRREANGNSPQEDLLVLKTDDQTGLDKSGTIAWSGGAETVVYGGQNDTWGLSLTPALVNANQLKLEYDTSYGEAQYDFVAITVYYSIVQGADTPTAVYDWAYDGNQILEERVNGNSGPKKQWVYGRYIDEPLIMDVDAGTGGSCTDFGAGDKRYFYHQNLNYSVVGLTDSNGVLVEANEYTPYGQFITLSHGGGAVLFDGTDTMTANGASPVGNPYLFTGRQFDPETGMYYYRHRYYDAVLGRFVSRDPIGYGDGPNIYQYANNSPISAADILGLAWTVERNGSPTTLATSDDPDNDTDEDLANIIGLDVNKFKNWATNDNTYYTRCGNIRVVEIPNVIVAAYGAGAMGDRWNNNIAYLKDLGFYVDEVKLTGTEYQVQNLLHDRTYNKTLHGFYFFGHGYYLKGDSAKKYKGLDYEGKREIVYEVINNRLSYKMGFAVIFACGSAEGEDAMSSKTNGRIWMGIPGVLHYIEVWLHLADTKLPINPGDQGTQKKAIPPK